VADDEPTLARQTLHDFLRLYHHFRTSNRQISESGVHPREFSLLRMLYERGPVTMGDVQAYIYRSPSTASTRIAKMEDQGYVTRTRSREDNRVVYVELTDAGRRIATETPMQGIPLLRRRLASLPEDKLARIDDALNDLLELMEVETVE
jgi:DNA-binding MarR family transcriptional regulator